MKFRKTLPLAVTILSAFGFGVLPATGMTSADVPSKSPPLSIESINNERFSASFGRSTSFVELESIKQGKDAATATLKIGGDTFKVSRNVDKGTATWSGGGAILTKAEKDALLAMAISTSEEVPSRFSATGSTMPDNVDLALRFLLLIADAPVGVVIDTSDVPAPVVTFEKPEDLAEAARTASVPCDQEIFSFGGIRDSEIGPQRACQQSNEDGIMYMSCYLSHRVLEHDATGHCLLGESIQSGPGSTDCLGKCGAGCYGGGAYTWDCGEHDRCGRVHGGSVNPYDVDCGDEYWEADDDFLWGYGFCG